VVYTDISNLNTSISKSFP